MGNKINSKVLKNQKGQSSVEYVLLLVIVVVFVNTVIGSDVFKNFFGGDSAFFQGLATGISRNYRYASIVSEDETIGESPEFAHPSFAVDGGGSSRFFVLSEEYPSL